MALPRQLLSPPNRTVAHTKNIVTEQIPKQIHNTNTNWCSRPTEHRKLFLSEVQIGEHANCNFTFHDDIEFTIYITFAIGGRLMNNDRE